MQMAPPGILVMIYVLTARAKVIQKQYAWLSNVLNPLADSLLGKRGHAVIIRVKVNE